MHQWMNGWMNAGEWIDELTIPVITWAGMAMTDLGMLRVTFTQKKTIKLKIKRKKIKLLSYSVIILFRSEASP